MIKMEITLMEGLEFEKVQMLFFKIHLEEMGKVKNQMTD